MNAVVAPVLEVFSSFQGEGPRLGERQIFVRFAGCDLRCAYCDTSEAFPAPPEARVQFVPDAERDAWVANPASVETILSWIERLNQPRGLHPSLSLTGGEPLLYPEVVRAVAAGARDQGLSVHLETGGHRPLGLAQVIDAVDEVSPDLKIGSTTWAPSAWEDHAKTFALLAETKKALAVKTVVGSTTSEAEIEAAAALVDTHLPETPLILQPVTRHGDGPEPPSAIHLARLHTAARRAHACVRAIPQTHRLLQVR